MERRCSGRDSTRRRSGAEMGVAIGDTKGIRVGSDLVAGGGARGHIVARPRAPWRLTLCDPDAAPLAKAFLNFSITLVATLASQQENRWGCDLKREGRFRRELNLEGRSGLNSGNGQTST